MKSKHSVSGNETPPFSQYFSHTFYLFPPSRKGSTRLFPQNNIRLRVFNLLFRFLMRHFHQGNSPCHPPTCLRRAFVVPSSKVRFPKRGNGDLTQPLQGLLL